MTEPGPPPRLRLVVPCYNEARRLDQDAFLHFTSSQHDTNLLFVDDGSTDRTPQILLALATRSPERIEIMTLQPNMGKVAAVQRGIISALGYKPELVGYWDADLSTPLEAVDDFLGVLDSNPPVDVVIGSRVKLLGRDIRRNELRHYVGRSFATAASMALGIGVYDTQCGAKVFRVTDAVVQAFTPQFKSRWVFDVELLARYIASVGREQAKTKIFELPLRVWVDTPGSKVRFWDGFRAAWDLLRIGLQCRRRP
jgi:glycosyltransferase involved in cell wall biosynthesis